MDNFIAADAEDGGSQDLARFRVHQDLHEALRFTLFDRAADFRHGALTHQRLSAALADFRLGHACPAKRRVDVERVRCDAIAHLTRIVVEQIGGDDFEVVVGRVREPASAVAIAEGPDARHVGPKLIVYHDVPLWIRGDAGFVQAQVVGVRAASHSEQHMRTADPGRFAGAIDAGDDLFSALREADAFCVQPNGDAFLLQDVLDGRRHVFIFTVDQARSHFEDGDLAAKTPVHLPELQTDVAAAHDDQMFRQEVDIHHGTVGEIGNLADPRQVGDDGAAAHVDEKSLGAEPFGADAHFPRRLEADVAFVHGAVRRALEKAFDPDSRLSGDGVLAGFDPLHVDAHVAADGHAEIGCPPRHVRGVRAGDHGLGGYAARVDAGAAEQLALGDRYLHPRCRQAFGQGGAGLPGADDDCVVGSHSWSISAFTINFTNSGKVTR